MGEGRVTFLAFASEVTTASLDWRDHNGLAKPHLTTVQTYLLLHYILSGAVLLTLQSGSHFSSLCDKLQLLNFTIKESLQVCYL